MRLLVVFMLLLSPGLSSKNNLPQGCLSYEPATVTLDGTITAKTFAGPPNYENIENGDEPETSWVLHLASPVCVNADEKTPEGKEAERDVSDVQLVFANGNQYAGRKDLLGKPVIVSGKLFHAITGHHHTNVLITVAEIKGAERKP